MRYVPLLLIAMTVAAQAGPATRAERAEIVEWAKTFFADPYALRSTEISDHLVVKGVPVLCVGFNGKNGYGSYAGVDRMPFEVTPNGLVSGARSRRVDTATCWGPEVAMRPFPELAAIR